MFLYNHKNKNIRAIKYLYYNYINIHKNKFLLFLLNLNFLYKHKNLFIFIYFFLKTKNVFYININNNILKKKNFFFLNNNSFKKYTLFNFFDFKNKFIYYNINYINSIVLPKNNNNFKSNSTSIYKNIDLLNIKNINLQYLRKNKVYNKGRYSRCRQNYRTGVYMCMYLSIVSIFGLYYWFFKFSFNFSYLWWFFIFFISSFFLPKIIKYRLYSINVLKIKTFDFFNWFFLLLKSLF